MNRGFIFTIDAALSLISVMILALLFTSYFDTAEPKTDLYEKVEIKASDAAIVGNHLNRDAVGMGVSASMPANSEFVACRKSYRFNAGSPTSVTENKYCVGSATP